MQWGWVRSVVGCGDADKHISWIDFSVFDKDVEVAILCKNACVDKLILSGISSATAVLLYQIGIGKGTLWIFVEGLHVRMRGCAVEVVVVLLYVLAMIALRTS